MNLYRVTGSTADNTQNLPIDVFLFAVAEDAPEPRAVLRAAMPGRVFLPTEADGTVELVGTLAKPHAPAVGLWQHLDATVLQHAGGAS
jgi:hypothetical protein